MGARLLEVGNHVAHALDGGLDVVVHSGAVVQGGLLLQVTHHDARRLLQLPLELVVLACVPPAAPRSHPTTLGRNSWPSFLHPPDAVDIRCSWSTKYV